jgi:PKD repeat protein
MKAAKNHFWLKLSAVLWLLAGASGIFAQTHDRGKQTFPSVRLPRQVRNEAAIKALGSNLPAIAAWYGKSTEEMAKLLRQDKDLWVSRTGRLVYACEMEVPAGAEEVEAADVSRDHIASFPLDQTFKLHSLPGSKRVLYLDFDGYTLSGTAWNSSYNGGATIVAAPFDFDGSPSTFSTTELQRIQNIWKRVAEDYAPFDVDVTTEEPAADALTRSSSSDLNFGNRVVITPTNFYPNAGGVSYVGSFDDVGEYYKTSWAFSNMLQNSEKYIAEAVSHENGHAVGLHHMGTSSTTYYQGQGDWAPIMGNSYYKNVTQWAKGEYTGANNTEDQLQVMQNYGLAYYADDHGNAADSASMLPVGTSLSATGFIERNTDVDVFKFAAGAGALSLSVTPSPLGPDLKILAELRDSGGTVLASPSLSNLGASISATVSAGNYYLAISGVGSGDPLTTGYSDYASLGQYILSGTVADPGLVSPPTAVISASTTSGEAPLAVSFSSSGSADDSGIAGYAWNFGDGTPVSNDPHPVHSYAGVGKFTATLTVTDHDGLTDSASAVISVAKSIYVSALTISSSSSSAAVSATATVTIKDVAGNPISGATVAGSWSGLVSATVSGLTNSSGVLSFSSPSSSTSGTFTFTVTGVTAAGCTYDAQLNSKSSASVTVSLQASTDSIAPTISITSPKDGSTVAGIVSVQVNASDNVGVKKVELYVDGKLTATSTTSPFTTKWNAKKASIGQHTLQVKAYDAAGNVGAASVVVNR